MSKGFLVTFLFVGAIMSGFGRGIAWVAQGEYTAQCATKETKGKLFSIFWFFYMSSQIIGNFIASLII